jgi:hypothetical protein
MTTKKYMEYLQSLTPPFMCVYKNDDYLAEKKDINGWTLRPAYKSNNNGEPIKVPLDTLLTHIQPVTFDKV